MRFFTKKALQKYVLQELENTQQNRDKSYQQEMSKKQADLATLQGQINPHFLYNALECIRGQAMINNVPEIADTTQALSRFYRYSISTPEDAVTLKDELENIKNYMKIQQFRFKNRFSLEIISGNVPETMDMLIPKLTLQPIVENAVVHGFKEKLTDAVVKVEVQETMRFVNIVISDNGKGMPPDKLAQMEKKTAYIGPVKSLPEGMSHTGIAMYNVNRRLQLFYGPEARLNIFSMENHGTDIELHLPKTPADKGGGL